MFCNWLRLSTSNKENDDDDDDGCYVSGKIKAILSSHANLNKGEVRTMYTLSGRALDLLSIVVLWLPFSQWHIPA